VTGSVDSLTVSALSHVILDLSHRDAKNRTLMDIPETRDEIFKSVFAAPGLFEGIKAGKIQVVFY
jgi:protein CMS1